MSFRKLRGVRLPEEQQGLIRYTCLTYASQPQWMREKIKRLCDIHGGEYSRALFEVMTSRRSMTDIAIAYSVSESVLYDRRRAFYENFNE